MSSISAGLNNSTSIVVTGDNTGNLVLKTNGTTPALTLDTNQNATFANSVTVTGTINATISGNGASLTDINASNITSGTISNARTTANSSNGASTIVARGTSGEFSAGAITGAYFIGDGSNVSAINASNISSGTIANARTSAASANGASTIVARDSDGSFAANVITANSFSGPISGNGAALTDINASNITSGTISNSRTTANSSNGAATIVLRGASGEFDAGAITAASFTGNGAAISGINASNISSGTIGNAYTTANSANGASTIVARDSNGSFTANAGTFTTLSGNLTGNVSLTTGTITTNAANSTDITNKAYVDGLFSTGISYHAPVRVESPTNLTVTYNQPNGAGNGVGATLTNAGTQAALVIDGVTLSVNDRVLVYTQTNQVQNGIYTVTNVGSGSTNWVMTRATDADTYGLSDPNKLGQGDAVFVQQGNTGAGETYVCNTSGTITFGTTNITFAQTSTAQVYSAGTGLTLNNLAFSISNTAVTAATYGDAGAVATFTVNAQGQITAASNAAINASSITLGTLSNDRTTAASANGASTIVARDSNGSFSANVVTAASGSFTSVSGNGIALTAINASNISSGTIANARTTASSSNGANTIVLRDASGDFEVDGITANWFTGNGANLSAINASNVSSGTLAIARGGTGASTLADANIAVINATNTFTALQTFNGTAATKAVQLLNGAETVNIVAAAPSATTNFYINSGAVQYYTSNASTNWTVNIAFSSGTSLNTAMATGDSITIALVTTQGATPYYASALTIDGSAVTPKYQGGTAWSSGKASGLDVYVYTVIKTASATYTVLASQTQFK